MSRSVHTRPRAIRAAHRLRSPYAPRAAAADVRGVSLSNGLSSPLPLPRVCETHPRPGHAHPLTRADILAALAFFGPECWYGVRGISIVQGQGDPAQRLRFGALRVPGWIVLYDQPPAPWTVPGRLPDVARARLVAAGAVVDAIGAGAQTAIAWPGDTLRRFFLFDVLMHEIGHHILQHETGKRTVRIARTRDHEAFAARFAAECRSRWEAAGA